MHPARQLPARPDAKRSVVAPLRTVPASAPPRRNRRLAPVALGVLAAITAAGILYQHRLPALRGEPFDNYLGALLAIAGGVLCLAALLLLLPRPIFPHPALATWSRISTGAAWIAAVAAGAFFVTRLPIPAEWFPPTLIGLVLVAATAPAAHPVVPLVIALAALVGYTAGTGWQAASLPLGAILGAEGVLLAVWPARLRRQAHQHSHESDAAAVRFQTLEIAHANAMQASEVAAAVLAVANACNTALDPAGIADRIAKGTSGQLNAVGTLLLLWDESLDSFRIGSVEGQHAPGPAALRQVEVQPDKLPSLRGTEGNAIVTVEPSALREPMLTSLIHRWKAVTLLGARLQRGDRLLGLLFVARTSVQGRFSQRDSQVLAGIAVHAAAALAHAGLIADLQAANHLKEEFMATMSHELRTPLNVIIGYTDLQLEGAFGDLGADHLDTLGRVREQAIQLLEMIQATLDTSRLERGLVTVDLRDISIPPFIEQLKAQVPSAWRKPMVELTWRLQTGLPMLRTDPGKLQIILRNLIHNALKFTHNGVVSVSATANIEKQRVTFVVQDSGVGIRAEHLSEIFEMFRQAPSGETNPGGVGLGLYIVKRLALVLGAEIDVSSAPQRGATFRVHVPVGGPLVPKGS